MGGVIGSCDLSGVLVGVVGACPKGFPSGPAIAAHALSKDITFQSNEIDIKLRYKLRVFLLF